MIKIRNWTIFTTDRLHDGWLGRSQGPEGMGHLTDMGERCNQDFFQDQDFNKFVKTKPNVLDQDFASQDQDLL